MPMHRAKKQLLPRLPPEPPIIGKGGVPLTVQWSCRRQRSSYLPAWHADLELQYIRRGLGRYFINGRPYVFGSRSLVLIKPCEVHHLALAETVLLQKCCLMLDPPWFASDLQLGGALKKLPHLFRLPPSVADRVEWILRQISLEYEAQRRQRARMLHLLVGELFIWLRRLAGGMAPEPPATKTDLPELVADLVDFLEQNFRRPIFSSELRERFGYAPDYLSRLLHCHFGCGFKQYLVACRLREAKRLLQNQPQMKIAAVAKSAGFPSFAVFNRVFQRMTGMTPGMFRSC